MLNWNEQQRAVLIDKLGDVASVAAGGLLFGQAIAGQDFSLSLALAGVGTWLGFMALSMLLARKREHEMGVYVMLGGILFFATLAVVWDLVASRYERRSQRPETDDR